MKKVLLGTSALALVGAFASPAASAEWDVRVGGFMTQAVGFGDSDANFSGDFDGIDVLSNTEIIFSPSITLDNGIKFGANVQLEGNTSGDQIDESYMFIKGSFGEILIGSENSAGYKMGYGPPSVATISINSGSMSAWIPFSSASGGANFFRATLGTTYLENAGNNDAQRITYFTPRFAGLQVGGSYARDAAQDSSGPVDIDVPGTLHDIFDVGVNYVNTFGDANVAVSGRYGTATLEGAKDPSIWSAGINVGFGGFTVGGMYAEQNGASALAMNGEAWGVGASYVTGPWGFSIEYFNGENQDNELSSTDENFQEIEIAGSYKLAKGVKLFAFGAWVDFEEDSNSADDVDGFVLGTGINLSF